MPEELKPGELALVTLYTPEAAAWGEISAAASRDYCAERGYAFHCHREALLPGVPAGWSRVPALLGAFEAGAKWAFWLDADAIILNKSFRLEALTAPGGDIVLAGGMDGLESCALLMRNGYFAKRLLGAALALREKAGDPAYSFGDALNDIYAAGLLPAAGFRVLGRRSLCSGIRDPYLNDFALHLPDMGGLARSRFMKSLRSLGGTPAGRPRTAEHGGDMGDVVYSVPLFRALGVERVVLNPASPYRTKMNERACAALKPLLERQGFRVEIDPAFPADQTDFYADIFREGPVDMENNHLSVTNSEKLAAGLDLSAKYLEAEPKKVADLVVNRSARYRNPDFDWLYLLDGLPGSVTAAFVGVKAEYDAFCRVTGLGNRVFYYPTADLHEAARVIAGARVFVGNQSSPYALAEGLKVNRIQETCLYTPNCRAQSDNAVDVKSREDLYGAKLKLFDWLGVPGEVPRPARKVLLYTVCQLSCERDLERMRAWLEYYLPRLDKLGASGLLLVDDGSPAELLRGLKAACPELALTRLAPLAENNKRGYELPSSIASGRLNLVSFPDRLGRPTEDLLPGWWRAYSFGALAAETFNFEKFIFIEPDAYLYSNRLFDWARNASAGFASLCRAGNGAREHAVQVCARSEFPRVSAFFRGESLNDRFWWGTGLSKYQYLPEHVLPFTNRLDEVRQFKIDRYGGAAWPDIPADADGCCGLGAAGPGEAALRQARRKLFRHGELVEAAERAGDVPALA